MSKPQAICDIECYSNYFLIAFLRASDDKIITFDFSGDNTLDVSKLLEIFDKYEIVTFNGTSYDIPLIRFAIKGATTQQLKYASDDLIVNEMKAYQFQNKYQLPDLEINTVDLIEVAPGKASLKIYGGRLHCDKMQDLPYDESKTLTHQEIREVKHYCSNDLQLTKLLLDELTPQIDLRRKMSNQYKCDLRSKSDAQIAETVIKAEISRKTGKSIKKPSGIDRFVYEAPAFISFKSKQLNDALNIVTSHPFEVRSSGKIDMPKELAELKIKMGVSIYQMGMGGLHSTEKSVHHIVSKYTIICDNDVTSFYPMIILNCGLYPKQMGEEFLDVYRGIVETRIAGKRAGDLVVADSLRIVINGSFGKLGSPYSTLYSPELMVQVTVTGQLLLLMLIEDLEEVGISVISGNTDGIVMKCPITKENLMTDIIKDWEDRTGFNMERTDYSGVYNRDVNNYIAVKTDGKVKTKGCFKTGGLQKNPTNEICNHAIIKYLTEGIDFEDTLRDCKDVTKFLTVRTVKGGAVKGSKHIGKAIRWYYSSTTRGTITYKTNNNTVPRSFGAKPCLDLPKEFPTDIDYDWYIRECKDLLKDIGINIIGQMDLF